MGNEAENINGNWSAFGMFGINSALKNKKFNIGSFSICPIIIMWDS